MTDFLIKPYSVSVVGFPDAIFFAASPQKARAAAWRAFSKAYPCAFGDFLKKSSVRKAAKPYPDFGKRITVSGHPAFFIEYYGSNIRFVREASEQILVSHPNDVEGL